MAYIQSGRAAPAAELSRLVERHGARATLQALVRVLARRRYDRRRTRRGIADLSPHLRRDIGLVTPAPGKGPVLGHWL